MKQQHDIVIVGGGAAGIALASKLGRRYRKNPSVAVTLVDKQMTHIWKPLLHEVAAGTFDSHVNEISFLAQAKRCGFKFRLGSLASVSREQKQINLDPIRAEDGTELVAERSFPYDTLVLAIGSVSNDFGVSGVAEHCLFLDTTEQAENFHRRLVQAYIRAYAGSSEMSDQKLSIAIVGAGATGVELAAQLHEVSELLNTFVEQTVNPAQIKLTIIEGAERILPALPDYLSSATASQLEKLEIDILTGEVVSDITDSSIKTRSGREIPCHLKVWAAGIKAPAVLKNCTLETNKINQLLVRQTLQSSYDDDIFAIGDCSSCAWKDDASIPPRAQSAHQQATLLGKSIPMHIAGKQLTNFHYRDYGSLVALGSYSTVGNLMGSVLKDVRIEGLIARFVYLSLYKMHQVSLFGFTRTMLLSVSNAFRRSVHPSIKLH